MLKSCGVGGGGGPCDFSVSPRSKSFYFLFWGTLYDLGACLDKGLDSDLDQGLTIRKFVIKIIVAKNENVNWNLKDAHEETPLMQAIKDGHNERVKIILTDPKIDLNIKDRNGWTALFWALKRNKFTICFEVYRMD